MHSDFRSELGRSVRTAGVGASVGSWSSPYDRGGLLAYPCPECAVPSGALGFGIPAASPVVDEAIGFISDLRFGELFVVRGSELVDSPGDEGFRRFPVSRDEMRLHA